MRTLLGYFEVAWRARTWGAIVYLLLGLPISILLFTYAVTAYAVGVSLVIIWVGIPLLLALQASLRPIGTAERALVNALLGARIPPPPPVTRPMDVPWLHRVFAVFRDGPSWRVLGWIMLRILLGPLGFVLAIVALVVPVSLIGAVGLAFGQVVGVWEAFDLLIGDPGSIATVDEVSWWVVAGSPVLLLLVPAPFWAVEGAAELHRRLGSWGLGSCDRERAEAAVARARLAEEQVRIDQELHDSIGHMITMNIVQAGAGAHVFDSDPEFARQALRNIEERGRAAMGELDRIIATIRGDDAGERVPLPGIADIPGLVDASRDAGIVVDAELDVAPVPPAIGRAAFGIVRESLTNAARHAPGAAVTVRVVREDDALAIDVANGPGGAPSPAAAGRAHHGVAGMRDRVTLLGGRTAIGPEPDGGYRVRALLPLESSIGPARAGSAWDDLREEVRA
ncbi:sensor histidine kinase [Demequina mangrovi]|uniref:histidine kinase n=1 Tax=Demequina mangrovi TaxID=1043493 RepID=A0A1H6WMB9_9MICO|nr:sensor domain-containing protein [Demequina mangrovi]SEJ18219.1 Signal transduction histidine kinase [Demequina mangrovi]